MKFVSIETATHDSIEQALDAAFAKVSVHKLAAVAGARYGATVEEILGPSHASKIIPARREAWRMAREMGWSLPEIARRFNRDHTTILHGLRAVGGVQ